LTPQGRHSVTTATDSAHALAVLAAADHDAVAQI
jgi:hypothetical protein